MADEVCIHCGNKITKDPVPVYHHKRRNEDDPYMWRHEDCPKAGGKPEQVPAPSEGRHIERKPDKVSESKLADPQKRKA